MVSRRTRKKKRTIFSDNSKGKDSEYRFHEHPYKTRSKSLRKMETTDLVETVIPSRCSSDSSVIYLGSFKKSPQLVTLEDSNEEFPEKLVQPEASYNIKNKKSFEVTYVFVFITKILTEILFLSLLRTQ